MSNLSEMNIIGHRPDPTISNLAAERQQEKTALDRDVSDAALKEIKSLTGQFQEGLGLMGELTKVVVSASNSDRNSGNSNVPSLNQLAKWPANTPTPSIQNPGTQMTAREYLCYMCNSKGHLMSDCDYLKEFMKRGWVLPEGEGSLKLKLRDGVRFPRGDANEARYIKIERIAKDRGWDKIEAYFANVEPEDDESISIHEGATVNPSVWMNRIDDIWTRLGNLEALRQDDVRVFNQEASGSGKNY